MKLIKAVTFCAVNAAILIPTAVAQSSDDGTGSSGNSSARQELGTVVIRSNRPLEERFSAAGSRVIVGRQDIENMGADSVTDVLKQLPGVQVTGEGSGNVTIQMRGMSAASTQILIDGERTTGSRRSAQLPLDQLPSEMIERIEVIRAPSAEFSGASAGTINIVLRQSSVKRETSIRLANQSVWGKNAQQLFASTTGPLREANPKDLTDRPWTYFVGGYVSERTVGGDTVRTTTASGTPTATVLVPVQNTAAEQSRFKMKEASIFPRINGRLANGDQLGLRMSLSAGSTEGIFSSNSVGTNNLGAASGVITETPASQRGSATARLDHTTRFKSTKLESYVSTQGNRENLSRPHDQSLTSGGVTTPSSSVFTDDRRERALLLSTKLSNTEDGKLWMVGAEMESRRFNLLSNNTAVATSNLNLGTVFNRNVLWGQNEWGYAWQDKTNSTLTAGLRYEQLRLDSDYSTVGGAALSQTNSQHFVQPSLHMRTPIDANSQWRLNLARIGKLPAAADVINRTTPSQGVNSPTNPNTAGNPLIKSESTITLDAGYEKRLGSGAGSGGQIGANMFVREVSDVLGRRTSYDAASGWTSKPDNMGRATVWGLEFDTKTTLKNIGLDSFSSDWSFTASATLLQSRMKDPEFGGARIPGQARFVSNISVAKPLRRTGGWYGGGTLNLQGSSDYVTSTSAAATGIANGGYNAGYQTLDLYIGRVNPSLGFWRLGVFNITNSARNAVRTTDSATYSSVDTSRTTFTPRVFLMIGTQF